MNSHLILKWWNIEFEHKKVISFFLIINEYTKQSNQIQGIKLLITSNFKKTHYLSNQYTNHHTSNPPPKKIKTRRHLQQTSHP